MLSGLRFTVVTLNPGTCGAEMCILPLSSLNQMLMRMYLDFLLSVPMRVSTSNSLHFP